MLSSAVSEVVKQINMLHKLSSLLQFHRRGFSQVIFSKTSHQQLKDSSRPFHVGSRLSKKEVYKDKKPLGFTQTEGGRLRVMEGIAKKDKPFFQEEPCQYRPYTNLASFVIFFGYFGFLREKNNLDAILECGLDDNLPELELRHLESAIPQLKAAGVSTLEHEARVKFLKRQQKQVVLEAKKGQEEQEERLRNAIAKMQQEGVDTTAASEKLNELVKKRSTA